MDGEGWPDLERERSLGDEPIPQIVVELAEGSGAEFVWRNQLGGLTFRIGERFVKWNPHANGIDLSRELVRLDWLDWLSSRHPAPRVLDTGADEHGQWLVTTALPGGQAIGEVWRSRRSEAIEAIAMGLRAMHAVPIDDFPSEWAAESWANRTPAGIGSRPPITEPVVVHRDACAPNTLISAAGDWVGNVDFGDLTVGDRWADLAIASMSLDWNFGEGHQQELFDAYGVNPDPERIRYYRQLWHLDS